MKVLSIKEPYATLIAKNIKHIETRSWKTPYRGKLYIHASLAKMPSNDVIDGLITKKETSPGYILCSCNLVDCIYMDDNFIKKMQNTLEYDLGFYSIGRYAWVLEDIKPVKKVKARGKLNIWEFEGEIDEL